MRNQSAEYAAGAPDLLSFYAAAPARLFEQPPHARPWAPELVEAIRAYQTSIGATSTFRGDEAVVITGQQPAVFAGPLYCIYKAATTLRLAERLQTKFGVPCVPVYWVGSEDHDFDEARTARFLTKSHRPHTFRYAPSTDVEGLPMYRVPLEASLHDAIDDIAAETAGSEFREEVRAFLHESAAASTSLADWTSRLLARLFRDTSLVFFAPHLAAARKLAAPVMAAELDAPLESMRLLNQTGERLEAAGFPPQIYKADNECGFFLEVEGRRRKVIFEKDRFTLPDEGRDFTRVELRVLLDAEPGRFSPNVGLRCIVQQTLFPVAAYVAGPGELAYWAQLKPLFELHEQPMPIVYPRAKAQLTTLKLNKIREKLGLNGTDLLQPEDDLLDEVMRTTSTDPAFALCQEQRAHIESAMMKLASDLDSKNKIAGEMARTAASELARRLDKVEGAILRSNESQNGAVRERLSRLLATLAPERRPQERYYSIFSFVFEHGWELVPRIVRELDIDSFAMNTVEL